MVDFETKIQPELIYSSQFEDLRGGTGVVGNVGSAIGAVLVIHHGSVVGVGGSVVAVIHQGSVVGGVVDGVVV